jgi:hypothetical protein
MELVACISLPRSGTNFILCNLLNCINNLNINLEVYDQTINSINHKYNNEEIANYSGDEKIDYLLKKSEEKYILHKIFPNMFYKQLLKDKWVDIINKSKYIIFIKRNFLDVFLSEKKIHITNTFALLDTSEIQIEFIINDYIMYKDNIYKEWFQKTKDKCTELNKPFIVLDYDIIKNISTKELQINYCIQKLEEIIDDEFSIIPKENRYNELFVKQDTAENYSQKISNYEAVKVFIENNKIHVNNII